MMGPRLGVFMSKIRDIKVHILCFGVDHTLSTYAHEYRNLMMLIYDRIYIDGFGECKGMGRCGTCHVQVLEGNSELWERQGNENTTLSKMEVTAPNVRLACQIMVDERLNGLRIAVME